MQPQLPQLIFFGFLLSYVYGFAYEYTVIVPPGKVECFYQTVAEPNTILEMEYQVLDGHGQDINFGMKDPRGQYLHVDQRTTARSHEVRVDHPGVFEFCFDNKFSHMNSKMIFFEVYADIEDNSFNKSLSHIAKKTKEDNEINRDASIQEAVEEIMDLTVLQIKNSLHKVSSKIERSMQHQWSLKATMKSDRSKQEDNFTRVNFFSAIYVFVMISVSLVQVMMIRNLFTTKDTHAMKVST